MNNYLDEQGLAFLWSKIVEKYNSFVPNISSLNAEEINNIFDQSINSLESQNGNENIEP